MADVFAKPSVERLVTSSTYLVGFSVLAGLLGWVVIIIASRADIGVGAQLLGFVNTAVAFNIIGACIAGGFNQSLTKYISESLVESKEKALIYAKSGFFIFNFVGLILFSIFFAIALWIFPNNSSYGIILGIVALSYFVSFFYSFFSSNIAGIHRFDYLGKIVFVGGIIGASIQLGILFSITKPLNALLLPLTLIITPLILIILIFYYGKKSLPYSLLSVFRGAHRREAIQILKYGFYCAVPNIINTGAILWIQTLFYAGLLGFATTIVGANGVIIGYASVALAICQIGTPQIPAISEARAMKNFKLIDDYMKTTLHNGFNMTMFLITIYIGISYIVLKLFHGPEYLFAQIPFILLSIAIVILGVEFLVCTLLMGLGEGRKAALLILSLTIIQICLVPFLIIYFNNIWGMEASLYAGSLSLLLSSAATFPLAFHYMKKYTHNPPKTYESILGKATISMVCSLLCYGFFELFVFPHYTSFIDLAIGLFVRGAMLFGFFVFFMLILAGLNDADLDLYSSKVGPLRIIIAPMRALLHHSPFYKKEEKENLKV